MGQIHTVEQGEFLAGIAAQYGFARAATIWDHPDNAALKEKRKNPNVLLAGDQIAIPDKSTKAVKVSAGKSSKFVVSRDKLTLRLVLEELYHEPMAGAEAELRVEGRVEKLNISDDGTIEFNIAPSTRSAELFVRQPEGESEGIIIPLRIGHLDPVDEPTGQVARLNNLGYFAGPVDGPDEQLLASAVEEFQCDHGLTVDGKCGPKTQKKLEDTHGC